MSHEAAAAETSVAATKGQAVPGITSPTASPEPAQKSPQPTSPTEPNVSPLAAQSPENSQVKKSPDLQRMTRLSEKAGVRDLSSPSQPHYHAIQVQNKAFPAAPASPPSQQQASPTKRSGSISKLGEISRGRVSQVELDTSMLHVGRSSSGTPKQKKERFVLKPRSKAHAKPTRLSIANLNTQNKDLESVVNPHTQTTDKGRNSCISASPRKMERNNPTQMKSIDTFKSRQY